MLKINRNSITILYITVYDTDGIYYAEYAILFSGKLFDIQLILIPLSNITYNNGQNTRPKDTNQI